MLLDIPIPTIRNRSLDCFEVQIASIALWLSSGYELMFANSWSFIFNNIQENTFLRIGERIEVPENHQWDLLKEYHGLKMKFTKSTDLLMSLSEIRKQLDKMMPVIIFMDSYWCPWDNNYKSRHSSHACGVVGLGGNDEYIICTDAYYQKKNIDFPLSYFACGIKGFATIEYTDVTKSDIDYVEILTRSLEAIKNTNMFYNIRCFAEKFREGINLDMEVDGYERINEAPILRRLHEVGSRRGKFAITLKHIGKKYNVRKLESLSDDLDYAKEKWDIVSAMLKKGLISLKMESVLKRVPERIYEIAEFEEKIMNKLDRLISDGITSSYENYYADIKNKNEYTLEKCRVEFLDISEYFNNKGFGRSIKDSLNADLTGFEGYFLPEGLPADNILELESIKFKFPDLEDEKNDNISCIEQTVKINKANVYCIIFLGCSENGHFSDRIKIIYDNGIYEEVPFMFTSWEAKPVFGDTVMWKGQAVEIKNGEKKILPRSLFAVKCFLKNYPCLVGQMHLPYCPNMHIFAISLHII